MTREPLPIRTPHGTVLIGAPWLFAHRGRPIVSPGPAPLAELFADTAATARVRASWHALGLTGEAARMSAPGMRDEIERAIRLHRLAVLFARTHVDADRLFEAVATAAPGPVRTPPAPPPAIAAAAGPPQVKVPRAVSTLSRSERVRAALERSLTSAVLGKALREALTQLLSPASIALTIAFMELAAEAQLLNPEAAVIVDAALLGLAYLYGGWKAIHGLGQLVHATVRAARARTEADIAASANDYADAFVSLGEAFFTFLLARLQAKRMKGGERTAGGTKDARGGRPGAAEEETAGQKPPAKPPAAKPVPRKPATLDSSLADYARPSEQLTARRLADTYPEFDGRTFKAPPPPDPGYDWIDEAGRTYDAMGDGTKSQYFKLNDFTNSIDSHLLKGNDFTVIDATGYRSEQVAQIRSYVDALSPAQQATIRRIGF